MDGVLVIGLGLPHQHDGRDLHHADGQDRISITYERLQTHINTFNLALES